MNAWSGADRVLVVIPTYNEAENLERQVAGVRSVEPAADILVVDDGSPDGTGEIADRLAARDDHVNTLHRAVKDGLGRAYMAGFRWGLDAGYDVLVEMDADGSHQPDQLGQLLAALHGADLALGSRYVPGGRVVDWPRRREWLSRGGNVYTRLALGIPLRDATGGYRAFRASALRSMDLSGVASHGYCFQVDLVWRAIRSGLRVVEVPITFVERDHGVSKMSGAIVREALVRITLWGVDHRIGQVRGLWGRWTR